MQYMKAFGATVNRNLVYIGKEIVMEWTITIAATMHIGWHGPQYSILLSTPRATNS